MHLFTTNVVNNSDSLLLSFYDENDSKNKSKFGKFDTICFQYAAAFERGGSFSRIKRLFSRNVVPTLRMHGVYQFVINNIRK